jgi:PAS domain S-box-containing protein
MSARPASSSLSDALAGAAAARWLPWVVAVLLALLTVYLWESLARNERLSIESAIESQATVMGDRLEGELRARVMAVVGLARRWDSLERPALRQWQSDARLLLEEQPGHQAILWIDPSLELQSILGRRGAAAIDTLGVRGVIRRAGLEPVGEGGYTLARAELPLDGAGLLTSVPVFRDSEFQGWVASIIDVSALIDAVWPLGSSGRSIAVVDEGGVIYERLGLGGLSRFAQARVGLNGLEWELRVSPELGLISEMQSPFPTLTLVLGLFGSALLGISIALWQKAHFRAGKLRAVNEALEAQIAERLRAEAVADEAHKRLEAVFRASPLAILALDRGGRVTRWNAAAEQLFGWQEHDVLGRPIPVISPAEEGRVLLPWDRVLRGEYPATIDLQAQRRDGSSVEVRLWAAPVTDVAGRTTGVIVVAEDITERQRLELQLLQAQKMESIGRLAGGIAHDFNNVLTAILGHAEIALNELAEDAPMRLDLTEVKKAAERAAGLTRQLLAFSRRQLLHPRVLDLNEVVLDIEKLLRRLIGEHIELVTKLAPQSGRIRADPGQIEQVIMNLAVNARDAMPEGGVLRIETANVDVLREYPRQPVALEPGRWALLRVSDNGVGMDEATRQHAFDPFFTTKEPGKGTGLGLSTVYGIVRQSGGHVMIESEPGRGTTVRVYLPRVEAPVEWHEMPLVPAPVTGGTETVLLVEDDEGVRSLARSILARNGYIVLEAATPGEAQAIVTRGGGSIDLLVTDVVMPEMSGRSLAERLRAELPQLKVLYMSGYMESPGARHDVPEFFKRLLSKPFTGDGLLRAVREALDSEDPLDYEA